MPLRSPISVCAPGGERSEFLGVSHVIQKSKHLTKLIHGVRWEAFRVGWERVDDETWEGGERGIFQVFTTPQSFGFRIYGLEAVDIKRLLDIGKSFDCPLYEAQKGKRYDDGTEPEV